MAIPSFPLRDRALSLLAEFVPRAGRAYAAQRNFDRGPDDRTNVSMLSPYVRHRVVTEEEVLAAILARHSESAAFKSVQEVMWRTYWKGSLETHPSVWNDYLAAVERLLGSDRDAPARERYARATSGETGIAAFDAWASELIATGYLHNHARMWFASIWIFTLELPWELGADFFLRRLHDRDPASNTLSWRWVAGVQTIGKTYLATRRNILHYTDGRLDPGPDLARTARYAGGASRPPVEALTLPATASSDGPPALLVLHDDDFGSATLPFDGTASAVVGLTLAALRSVGGVSANVTAFTRDVAREAVAAAATRYGASDEGAIDVVRCEDAAKDVVRLARSRGLERIVVPYGTVGPGRDAVDALRAASREGGVRCDTIVRAYDALTWPKTPRGFFPFAKQIPAILRGLALTAAESRGS